LRRYNSSSPSRRGHAPFFFRVLLLCFCHDCPEYSRTRGFYRNVRCGRAPPFFALLRTRTSLPWLMRPQTHSCFDLRPKPHDFFCPRHSASWPAGVPAIFFLMAMFFRRANLHRPIPPHPPRSTGARTVRRIFPVVPDSPLPSLVVLFFYSSVSSGPPPPPSVVRDVTFFALFLLAKLARIPTDLADRSSSLILWSSAPHTAAAAVLLIFFTGIF